jgi:hypothetical protein
MKKHPYNETNFNVGNSIYPGFNDKNGVMICGYEYGYSKHDEYLERECKDEIKLKSSEILTFFNKSAIYESPYDKRIIKWFNLFGHPLGKDNGESNFDKCLLQTNWCDDQGHHVKNYNKFLDESNVSNFLKHADEYMPMILIFMGSRLIHCLQHESIKNRFSETFGNEIKKLDFVPKDFDGRKFKIGFQQFEKTTIVSFPHPSGTRGLSDDYIKLFQPEIFSILTEFKLTRSLAL